MDDNQQLQIKKLNSCQDNDELIGDASTSSGVGLHASSSSSGLPDIVQMVQANNAFTSSSFCLNQGDP